LDRIPSAGPAIVVCNHTSYFDPLANAYAILQAGRRPRFLAKDDLFTIPLVGRALRGAGQIPVRRGSGDRSPLLDAERAIDRGEVVVIYPEGTVTTRPDHLPMEGKTGAVRLSLATGVPVIPMACWGSQAVWQKSGRGSLTFGRPVWVKVGEPLDLPAAGADPHDYETVTALTARVIDALTELAVELRDRYPKRWAQ
jgi:1-acyl-sn-glycerol-3-phosphate acyltransferase